MSDLLLNTTAKTDLLAAIFPDLDESLDHPYSYVISLDFFSSKGGGKTKLLGVFSSKEKAAVAFLERVQQQFAAQNAAYRKHVEEEDYFEEEPSLEYWEERQVYRFQCENTFYDSYEWRLTQLVTDQMDAL